MKTPGWLLRRRWFLVAVLSFLVALSPMVLVASPAHAESTYDDYLAQLQAERQELAGLLARYQSYTTVQRAWCDAQIVHQGWPQNMLSFYNALSAGDQAELDKEALQATGNTFSQLAQGLSTLPGALKVIDTLFAAVPNFSGGGGITPTPITPTPITPTPITPTPITPTPITPTPITPTPITPTPITPTPITPTPITPTPTPPATTTNPPATTTNPPATTTNPPATTTKPETPAEPPTTSSPSGIIGFEPPAQGGEVYLGSGELKLGWVLYGRTDLTDEEAQAIYDRKIDARKQELDASLVVATEGLEKAKRQLEMYEKIIEENDQQKIISTLKEDLAEAKKESEKANEELGILLAKELAKGLGPNIKGAIELWDYGAGIKDILMLVGKTERTPKDWENAGKGLVSVLKAASAVAGLKLVEPVGSVAELAAGVIYLHLADERVTVLESSISQTTVSLENNRRRLQYEIARKKATSESVQRDIMQLTTKTYLDLR